jgi:hypothetical protein
MPLSSELIFGCVHMFATTLGAEQRMSTHQCKDAPCSGAAQGTMPSSFFFKNLSKNPDNCVETDHTSERFLTETRSRKK